MLSAGICKVKQIGYTVGGDAATRPSRSHRIPRCFPHTAADPWSGPGPGAASCAGAGTFGGQRRLGRVVCPRVVSRKRAMEDAGNHCFRGPCRGGSRCDRHQDVHPQASASRRRRQDLSESGSIFLPFRPRGAGVDAVPHFHHAGTFRRGAGNRRMEPVHDRLPDRHRHPLCLRRDRGDSVGGSAHAHASWTGARAHVVDIAANLPARSPSTDREAADVTFTLVKVPIGEPSASGNRTVMRPSVFPET